MPKSCRYGGPTKANSNCTVPGDDGLPVQCVGTWTGDKHDILRRYIEATRATRSKYLPPRPNPGGAAYVDLFAGPGRARIRGKPDLVDGSPLIAVRHQEAPFTRVVLCDADPENVAALRLRTKEPSSRVVVEQGDCNGIIDTLAAEIPEGGLNLALVDPFSLKALRFETVAKLAAFRRMDLIVFFPVWEIRRFAGVHRATYAPLLTRALGTSDWEQVLRHASEVPQLIRVFHRQLETRFGYTPNNTYSAPIMGSNRVALYHLVFASKHSRGDRIWESVTRRSPGGQRRLW